MASYLPYIKNGIKIVSIDSDEAIILIHCRFKLIHRKKKNKENNILYFHLLQQSKLHDMVQNHNFRNKEWSEVNTATYIFTSNQ